MADGLWVCDSNVEVGLAQRADEFPDGLVQSSDILVGYKVYIFSVLRADSGSKQMKAGKRLWGRRRMYSV